MSEWVGEEVHFHYPPEITLHVAQNGTIVKCTGSLAIRWQL